MGHSFEKSTEGDAFINFHRPDGHAQLDQKYDKAGRTPWLSMLPQEAGLVSPETSEQDGSGHMDSGFTSGGGI